MVGMDAVDAANDAFGRPVEPEARRSNQYRNEE